MERQLTLIDSPPSWQLDEQTREVGRHGIEMARAALRSARLPADAADDPGDRSHRQRPAA
jgi:hypothetical protein